jgi:hypothetical protein
MSVGGGSGSEKIALTKNGSGHLMKRRSTGKEILLRIPMKKVRQKRHAKGFCSAEGNPRAIVSCPQEYESTEFIHQTHLFCLRKGSSPFDKGRTPFVEEYVTIPIPLQRSSPL